LFPVYLRVQNTGKTAIKNVQVTLRYPETFCLHDLSLIVRLNFQDKREMQLRPEVKDRKVANTGGLVQVIHDHPLFRPGENILFFEPVIFHNSMVTTSDPQRQSKDLPLEIRLHNSGIAASFALDVYVSGENCQPV